MKTEKLPKLTNIEIIPIKVQHNSFLNFNTIILIVFIVFFVFFLSNCKKGGMFTDIDYNPVPYDIIK